MSHADVDVTDGHWTVEAHTHPVDTHHAYYRDEHGQVRASTIARGTQEQVIDDLAEITGHAVIPDGDRWLIGEPPYVPVLGVDQAVTDAEQARYDADQARADAEDAAWRADR